MMSSAYRAIRWTRCRCGARGNALVAVVLLAGLLAGCGRRGLQGTVPVEGTVTFGGGACPGVGCVYFMPADETAMAHSRAGWARFEKDGRYRVTTLVTYDGLLPGTYSVRVECQAVGGSTGHEPGESLVPASVALPPLVVPAGARKAIRFDIDVGGRSGGASGESDAGG